MAERSIEKGRGMSPIRGYPPLMRKENQTPRLFAVAGFSVINASAEFIASIQGDISDPSEQCAVSAASEMIAVRLHDFGQIVPIRLSNEFQAWRIELSGDSPLLDCSIGLMLNYKVLEELAAQILTRLSLVVQFVVSSVYPDTDDISLALDAVTSLEALKAGVQEIFSMLEEDYQPEPAANKLTLITGYIMEHYQDCNLDASQICEVFDIAPPSLSRMFRREMNTTMGSTFPYIPKGDAASPLINTEAFTLRGLDHELWLYAPIYAGDHVESKLTSQSCTDITVPGTDIRKFRVEGTNDLYNEDGTLLMHGHYRAVETYKVFADAAMMQDYPGDKAIRMATHCDWDHMRPRHVYTEEDYQNIVTLWKNEEIRGSPKKTTMWIRRRALQRATGLFMFSVLPILKSRQTGKLPRESGCPSPLCPTSVPTAPEIRPMCLCAAEILRRISA